MPRLLISFDHCCNFYFFIFLHDCRFLEGLLPAQCVVCLCKYVSLSLPVCLSVCLYLFFSLVFVTATHTYSGRVNVCVMLCLFLLIPFLSTVCVFVSKCVWRLESRLLVLKSLLLSIVSVWAWLILWLYTWLIAAALTVISPHCYSGWVTDGGFDRERRGNEPDSWLWCWGHRKMWFLTSSDSHLNVSQWDSRFAQLPNQHSGDECRHYGQQVKNQKPKPNGEINF